MYVEYWGVGATTSNLIKMTTDEISSHLLADWAPGLPTSARSSLMGWPTYLLQTAQIGGVDFLSLSAEAGRTERQWKGVLSWMLGIAGARHILGKERYRWIAPLSAFYSSAVHPVSYMAWPTAYPRSSIVAERATNSSSNLRPDYVALRPAGAFYEWAVVEAKGTHGSLKNRTVCPADWYDQARSVQILHYGSLITAPRHLVIATRVNPNAVNPRTRRLHVRAWNSTADLTLASIPSDGAVDIVAAHLYGFFRNLRLLETAHAIALSTEMRSEDSQTINRALSRRVDEASDRAEDEMRRLGRINDQLIAGQSTTVVSIDTDFGQVSFDLSQPLTRLARVLWSGSDHNVAAEALREVDPQLDDWERRARLRDSDDVTLPFGVQVRLPAEFGRAF